MVMKYKVGDKVKVKECKDLEVIGNIHEGDKHE